MLKHYSVNTGGGGEEKKAMRLMGRALGDGKVYLPVRILHRDLAQARIPVLRYDIHATPDQIRTQTKDMCCHFIRNAFADNSRKATYPTAATG
jgi:hypothetical protein